jgi:hypothetical protein
VWSIDCILCSFSRCSGYRFWKVSGSLGCSKWVNPGFTERSGSAICMQSPVDEMPIATHSRPAVCAALWQVVSAMHCDTSHSPRSKWAKGRRQEVRNNNAATRLTTKVERGPDKWRWGLYVRRTRRKDPPRSRTRVAVRRRPFVWKDTHIKQTVASEAAFPPTSYVSRMKSKRPSE